MERLIAARLDQVAGKQQKLLDEALKVDGKLRRQLPSFRFDADQFCASPTAATYMRSALAAGDVSDANFTTAVLKPIANGAR